MFLLEKKLRTAWGRILAPRWLRGLASIRRQFHGYSTACAFGARLGKRSILHRGIAIRPRSSCFSEMGSRPRSEALAGRAITYGRRTWPSILGVPLSQARVEWIKDACAKISNICDVATYKRHRMHLCGRGK
jgi:hypothetical protein